MMNKTMQLIVWILLVIGGLNWGLVGILDFNLVSAIFGDSIVSDIIYILVGIAGIFGLVGLFKKQDR